MNRIEFLDDANGRDYALTGSSLVHMDLSKQRKTQ